MRRQPWRRGNGLCGPAREQPLREVEQGEWMQFSEATESVLFALSPSPRKLLTFSTNSLTSTHFWGICPHWPRKQIAHNP